MSEKFLQSLKYNIEYKYEIILNLRGGHMENKGYSQTIDEIGNLEIKDRMFIVSKIYNLIDTCFIGGEKFSEYNIDKIYEKFLERVIKEEDRFKFGLLMMEFLAGLKNGLTRYYDPLICKNYNCDLGFKIVSYDGKWIVKNSRIKELIDFDVVSEINGKKLDDFFNEKSKYISASSEREAKTRFSDYGILFPLKFSLKLEGGRIIFIDRTIIEPFSEKIKPEGRWLKDGEIAYLKIPSFSSREIEEIAINNVNVFNNSKSIIIDLRENKGKVVPYKLINVLMDRPYRFWSETTPANIGILKSHSEIMKSIYSDEDSFRNSYFKMCRAYNDTTLMWGSPYETSTNNIFKGKINILVDSFCSSAAEDFILPFKDNKRATIMGEKTMGCSGLPLVHTFDNGILTSVITKKPLFPDGSRFDGVGISPDIGIHPTLDQLKGTKDAVLSEALRLTNMFSR